MSAKIVVAEDDTDVRAFLAEILSPSFQVLQASAGDEAVALVVKERPQLLLLDVSLPGLGGIEVLKKVRAHDPGLIVVMLTSQQDTELASRALTLGAREYITKPAGAEYIRSEIAHLLAPAGTDHGGRPWKLRS